MYIVTGGAGFIGSNLVRALNQHGIFDVLIVDQLKNPAKLPNLHGLRFVDFLDKQKFRAAIVEDTLGVPRVEAIFHQGACSNTLEDDGVYMMDNNTEYSKDVLRYAVRMQCPFVYASTAAVYGLSGAGHFAPEPTNEKPLNVYGFSKLAFDNYVRHQIREQELSITVAGLRYFNVYGPHEQHKGRMASTIHHFARQIRQNGTIRLFGGSGGYGPGEQRRDFIFVNDIAAVNLFFAGVGPFANRHASRTQTVVNVGTGCSRSFNDVARALMTVEGGARIEYIPFPGELEGRYQHFTEADITSLRALGYGSAFTSLEEGVQLTFATR